MGGSGQRFGRELPKQFTPIKGKPYFSYIFADYVKLKCIDKFIVVTNPDYMSLTTEYAQSILGDKLLGIVHGGDSNLKSTYNGIIYAAKHLNKDDIVLTHDITNSSIDEDAIVKVIEAAKVYGAATNGTEQVQTLFLRNNDKLLGTISKPTVASGYSPDAYRMSIIESCFDNATEDELMNMPAPLAVIIARGIKAKVVFSNVLPLKLTYEKDLEIFMKVHGLWEWKN